MGIDLALYASRPGRRTAAVRTWTDSADKLAPVLGRLTGDQRLGAIDPYNDTTYNEQQAEAALKEVGQLRELCADDGEKAAVAALAEMLAECAGRAGSYLQFTGD